VSIDRKVTVAPLDPGEQADQLIVLDHGRIVESDTHTDLPAADGRYAHLWHSWTGTPLRTH
jgi:ABC-type transport system involved in cytochrome bd biosynthesis fused ATPase/permease subunit